jgi:hypothetical protein
MIKWIISKLNHGVSKVTVNSEKPIPGMEKNVLQSHFYG